MGDEEREPTEDEKVPETPAPPSRRSKAPGHSTRRDAPVVLERAIPDRDLWEKR